MKRVSTYTVGVGNTSSLVIYFTFMDKSGFIILLFIHIPKDHGLAISLFTWAVMK